MSVRAALPTPPMVVGATLKGGLAPLAIDLHPTLCPLLKLFTMRE
jgi:hypothetical protein